MSPASIMFFQAILNLIFNVQNTEIVTQIKPPIVEISMPTKQTSGTTTVDAIKFSSTTTNKANTGEQLQKSEAPTKIESVPTPKIDTTNGNLIIVNKSNPLTSSYIPTSLVYIGNGRQLKNEASEALGKLMRAAQEKNITLRVLSAYRSYADQKAVYARWVQKDGKDLADTYSARPGYSEHQTGLAIDLGSSDINCDLEICFANSEAGKWIALHAHEYGFILRFPINKEHITGYQYEPWHIRYVGIEAAKEMYLQEKSLEEYLGFPPAPNY